ncbi:MAG: TrkH family potassium uptake protein [Clostridia bacterium]|nr:TrkH family potassium uptake protein [Clostridia bacterium]
MNFKTIRYTLSRIMLSEAAMMLISLGVSLIYGETDKILSFIIPIAGLVVFGALLGVKSQKDGEIYARDGFAIVAFSWILMSLFGAVPLVISGMIPNYVDAVFETVSGFTTSGTTIMTEIEKFLAEGFRGVLFWRSFTHWIGGMGVLVFVMAVLPMSGNRNMHIMRAEVPGPEVGKLVSKVSNTAKILYGIYLALTLIETAMLFFGGMPLYESFIHSFGTAGTGGFSVWDASIGHYAAVGDPHALYYEMVITVFMLLFGVNFNLFYFMLLRQFKASFKNEELKLYFGIVTVATFAIAVNILNTVNNFGQALRQSVFQVASLITTTGYGTVDLNTWPSFSKTVVIFLMFLGAMAGSTGGGFKLYRILILCKSAKNEMRRLIHPNSVIPLRIDDKTVDEKTVKGTYVYFVVYSMVLIISVLLIGIDPASVDFTTAFSSTLSCLNNIGPIIGGQSNFAAFTIPSKLLFTLDMLLGRLEIFPILMIFFPSMWNRRKSKVKKIKFPVSE